MLLCDGKRLGMVMRATVSSNRKDSQATLTITMKMQRTVLKYQVVYRVQDICNSLYSYTLVPRLSRVLYHSTSRIRVLLVAISLRILNRNAFGLGSCTLYRDFRVNQNSVEGIA